MLVHRRCFSSTPAAFAKRRQIAIQRKKANVARQAVLKAERTPANFNPIIGVSTPFTRALLTPAAVWTPGANIEDSLYFPKEQLSQIQSAVEKAFVARQHADAANEAIILSSRQQTPRQDPALPVMTAQDDALDSVLAVEEKLMNERLHAISLTNSVSSEASSRIASLQNSNARTLRAYNTAFAIREFGRAPGDTGSAEVQAAILTARIVAESAHIANNRKDVHGFRGFRGLVHQRQKVLKYLRTESVERYFSCIERLGLSDQAVVREITM